MSFSLFGLYLTLVTGLLIIIVSFILEPIFQCLYNRRKYKEYTYLEWAASETLQLQRIGFQGINTGTWSGCTDPVPRTKPGEVLTGLALKYSPHTENTLGIGGIPGTANSNTTTATDRANWDQVADLVSLDDLLDTTAYENIVTRLRFRTDWDSDQIDSEHAPQASKLKTMKKENLVASKVCQWMGKAC